jgi:hypothetical protein
VPYNTGAGATSFLVTGSAGQVLTSGGSGSAPTWNTPTAATGAGGDAIFLLNGQTVNNNYSIPSTQNAMSTGPINIASGVTVTIPAGSRWVVL